MVNWRLFGISSFEYSRKLKRAVDFRLSTGRLDGFSSQKSMRYFVYAHTAFENSAATEFAPMIVSRYRSFNSLWMSCSVSVYPMQTTGVVFSKSF